MIDYLFSFTHKENQFNNQNNKETKETKETKDTKIAVTSTNYKNSFKSTITNILGLREAEVNKFLINNIIDELAYSLFYYNTIHKCLIIDSENRYSHNYIFNQITKCINLTYGSKFNKDDELKDIFITTLLQSIMIVKVPDIENYKYFIYKELKELIYNDYNKNSRNTNNNINNINNEEDNYQNICGNYKYIIFDSINFNYFPTYYNLSKAENNLNSDNKTIKEKDSINATINTSLFFHSLFDIFYQYSIKSYFTTDLITITNFNVNEVEFRDFISTNNLGFIEAYVTDTILIEPLFKYNTEEYLSKEIDKLKLCYCKSYVKSKLEKVENIDIKIDIKSNKHLTDTSEICFYNNMFKVKPIKSSYYEVLYYFLNDNSDFDKLSVCYDVKNIIEYIK